MLKSHVEGSLIDPIYEQRKPTEPHDSSKKKDKMDIFGQGPIIKMPKENTKIGKSFVKVSNIGDGRILFFKREKKDGKVTYTLEHHNQVHD